MQRSLKTGFRSRAARLEDGPIEGRCRLNFQRGSAAPEISWWRQTAKCQRRCCSCSHHGLLHLQHQTAIGGRVLEACATEQRGWDGPMHCQSSGMALWQVARQAGASEPAAIDGLVLAQSLVQLSVKALLQRRPKSLRVMYFPRPPAARIVEPTERSSKIRSAGLP